MALPKQNLSIPFGQGVDTKSDPKQVQPGKLLALVNSVFTAGNLLQKRNGFGELPSLPEASSTLTTFGGALTAIGKTLNSYAPETKAWYNKGAITSVDTDVMPVVRSSTSQTAQDSAVTSDGLSCTVWSDSSGSYKYQINDTTSLGVLVSATSLPASATQARAFVLGRYFIITFLATVSAATHLQYIAIPILTPQSPMVAADIGLTASSLTAGYDGYVTDGKLYICWSDAAPKLRITYLTATLQLAAPVDVATRQASYMGVTADMSGATPVIWVAFWDAGNSNLYGMAFSSTLGPILAPTVLANSATIVGVTCAASSGTMTAFYDTNQNYSYVAKRSDFISKNTVTSAGVVGSASIIRRSVGLAMKAFTLGGTVYLGAVYGGSFQPTYFLLDSSGNIIAKLAYTNAGGYVTTQVLASAWVYDDMVYTSYLFKDLLTSISVNSDTQAIQSPIYSQTGINVAQWIINANPMHTAEIGNNLHMAGGYLWMYDGAKPVEHGFLVWPEDLASTTATGSGGLVAQQYYYVATYEWTDAQGNIHRSAPSVPLGQLTTTASSTNTIRVPTLRLTAKTGASIVRIVIYRWSTAQQNYYQITSITSPVANSTTVDNITYVDSASDSAILGNQLLYTTGGVVENIAAPPVAALTLYKSRLVAIDAENKNSLWFSKQVIQNTPVEMSDLFTIFVAPTAGAQGSTGVNTAISAMDDKLILFKRNAIYYVTGTGPDNTGANNDFSEPNYITSTAGCTNQASIVFTPLGLMFQSDKGIWLLSRDLSTTYIGSPVERFNSARVLSALNIPGTNQVRFTLDNGITLMYDYFFGQWGWFEGIPGIASTLFQNLHTFVNSRGAVYQETPGSYVDGTAPVLMRFQTGWLSLAGLQGFERSYFFTLLGEYLSPHKLAVQLAYDYQAPTQAPTISPDNFTNLYGQEPGPYGSGTPFGGIGRNEQWRIFFDQQKVQAFQISINEVYDSTKGVAPGAGFTLSGINLVVSQKKGYRPFSASNSTS